MGPSIASGASIRLRRKAAVKVIVFPMAERRLGRPSAAFRTPARQRLRLDPGLVDEDKAGGIDAGLTRFPAFALARDIRAILLAGEQVFLTLNPCSRRSLLIPGAACSTVKPGVVKGL
jgi:hypothetical protein